MARPVDLLKRGRRWKNWYSRANRELMGYCVPREWDPAKFAAALAIASPRVQVNRSVRIAKHWMKYGHCPGGTLGNVRAAFRHYVETGEIRGPKTYPFYCALLGDHQSVVVDVWMARAYKVDPKLVASKYVLMPIVADVMRLARIHKLTPRQAQAAIWAGSLIEHGRNPFFMRIEDDEQGQRESIDRAGASAISVN